MFFVIDLPSFLIGLVTASIFWWLVARARPLLTETRAGMQEKRESALARRTSNIEENHRRTILRRAQGMHLAAPLFALDEILQEPRLLAPFPAAAPGETPVSQDTVREAVPYLPTWPEFSAVYNPQTISLPQALAGGRNLVITGHPGAGKSVALAHLASLSANRSPLLGTLQEHVPFLLHAADLRLPIQDPKHVLDPVNEVADALAPVMDLGKLPGFIDQTFRTGRALLLLDGFDELPVEGQKAVSDYLKLLLQTHPKTRIVVTGAFESLDGLIGLNFAPLALSGWNQPRVETFFQCWGELWTRFVSTEAWAQTGPQAVDPLLLNGWLSSASDGLSPFELTMLAWAAYAGDGLGAHVVDAISTHIRRLAPANTPVAALDTLALQAVVSSQPVFDTHSGGEWVRHFELVEPAPGEAPAESDSTDAKKASRDKPRKDVKTVTVQSPSSGLLSRMAGSGLLVMHPNSRMRFAHPIFEAFLAGRALNDFNSTDNVLNQPDWIGKILTLRFLAVHSDATKVVERLLEWSRLPMHRPLLAAARWLRDAPREAPWRGKVMAALVELLQSEGLPLALRGQAAAALALSRDPGAPPLFRQLMNTLSFELVQLCALGSGVLRDTKAVKTLEAVLNAPSLAARQAACLALVAIGTEESEEAVAHTLLQGDEELRRTAAEALANDPQEGHSMLREGAGLSDILVRRAVVYGLARVDQPWSDELLRKVQIDDGQWVVRNAAAEVLENKSRLDPSIPRTLPAPSETPWILEFAGTQGVGVPPGSPATEILLAALNSPNTEIRRAALPYLMKTPTEGVVTRLYQNMYSDDPEMREAIYIALMEIASSGLKLPHPTKFGIA